MNKIQFLKGFKAFDPFTYLLLHMNGGNGSTTYSDSSMYMRTVTVYGNTVQSTSQVKFGTSASSHDGSGDYLSIGGINPGTAAFCFEAWVYITNTGRTNILFSYGGSNETINNGFVVSTNTGLILYASGNQIAASGVGGSAWHHIALVGNGGASGSRTLKLYLDGTQVGSTKTTDYNYTGQTIWVGANEDSSSECMLGYIDDVRISVGVERYTSNFTPTTIEISA